MTYKEFSILLETQDLDIKDIAPILGYSKNSISNNWSKAESIPEKALIALNLFLELKQEKEERVRLKKQLEKSDYDAALSNRLSEKALKIAEQKCIENNISIEEYISSLVISNI